MAGWMAGNKPWPKSRWVTFTFDTNSLIAQYLRWRYPEAEGERHVGH